MKARIEFDKSLIILIIILIVAAGTILFLVRSTRTDSMTEMIENKKNINSAFLVHDGDRLIFTEIMFYSTETAKAALLDIPGETGVILEKLGKIDRIDKVYTRNNPEEYLKTVEKMIEQQVDYYFQIDLGDFIALVDLIGGLEMFIPNPVEIIDDDQTALLPSGSILLDGDKARTFITYTDPDEGDIEESGRREKIIQSLLKSFQEEGQLLTSDRMFHHIKRTLDTNADDSSLKTFIKEMENLDSGRIVFQRVLGVKRTVDDQILLFSHYDGNLLRETVRQTVTSLANIDVVSDDELNIVIEILNGTAVNGLAARTSQVFQSFGYDVAHIGNYDDNAIEKTYVIDRNGDISQAQRIASIIKCTQVKSMSDVPEGLDLPDTASGGEEIDLTIILGKDFDGRYCKE